MKLLRLLLPVVFLYGCAAPSPLDEPFSEARFLTSGPGASDEKFLSMHWEHDLQIAFDRNSISKIDFSCTGIREASFSATRAELMFRPKGVVSAKGPMAKADKDAYPWLYDNQAAETECSAGIQLTSGKEILVKKAFSFSAKDKAGMVQNLRMNQYINAQPHNSGETFRILVVDKTNNTLQEMKIQLSFAREKVTESHFTLARSEACRLDRTAYGTIVKDGAGTTFSQLKPC